MKLSPLHRQSLTWIVLFMTVIAILPGYGVTSRSNLDNGADASVSPAGQDSHTGSGTTTDSVPQSYSIPNGPVAYETIDSGSLSGYLQPGYFVINNQTRWSDIWSQAFCKTFIPCPSTPKVDFTQQTALVAFLGQRSNGCCQIAFTGVESNDSEIAARLVIHVMSSNCITVQAETAPYSIIEIPKTTQS